MTPQQERLGMDLRFISTHSEPIWGGPLKLGLTPQQAWGDDPSMMYMIETGLIRQVGTQGYVITDKGMKLLQTFEFASG